jgi:nucleotide-binding universal stress UspA family protein
MFDTVLVGIGEDRSARDAIELARELTPRGGSLMLVSVDVVALPGDTDRYPAWEVSERRRELERLASLRDEAHLDARLLSVRARSAAAGLHEAARRHGDLLVIGASGHDDYGRMFAGDDTREVLKDPPCPVAVAPPGYAARAPVLRMIGVAYDGSAGSQQALAVARRLARERDAKLSVFEAVAEPVLVHDPWSVEAEIEDDVAKARERLGALGGVEPHAASGDAAEELARYAASVDLLVLGPHQHRAVDPLTNGSVSQRLADTSPAPLLVLAAAS